MTTSIHSEEPQLAAILFDPDRDRAFAALAEGPAVVPGRYFDGTPVWLVTGYDEIRTVLTSPRFSNDVTKQSTLDLAAASGLPADVRPYLMHTLGTYDPPDHTRLRRLVSSAFTARRVERLRPRIQLITDELLAALADTDEADLLQHLAYPLPIRVICELLGVPAGDQNSWRVWSDGMTAPDLEQVATSARGLVGYIRDLIADKRGAADRTDDLLSALIQVHDADGERLSDEELVSVSISILLGGHATTVALLANGTLLLLSTPGLFDQLRRDPDLVPGAVEELLRYRGPAEIGAIRHTLEAVEIAGVTIPAGEPVVLVYASGNRDAHRFDAPERLDLTRADNAHLGFGHGIHFCIGAALARAEGDIAFRGLVREFPDLTLAVPADQVAWRPGLQRLPETLPVRPHGAA